MFSIFRRIGDLYQYDPSFLSLLRPLLEGAWRTRMRGEALVFAGRELMKDWSVVDRLGAIRAPTLVVAGRQDFVFPPECQEQLAGAIPQARLEIIDRAGHNPHTEQADLVMSLVRQFIGSRATSDARIVRAA